MGLTFVEGTVTGSGGEQREVKFLVDSGASYTVLPHGLWQQLGLRPKRKATFTLADGTTLTRDISECHVAVAGVDGHSPVVLGEPGDEAVLGVVTLEVLGLVLDPFKRTLQTMRLRLA